MAEFCTKQQRLAGALLAAALIFTAPLTGCSRGGEHEAPVATGDAGTEAMGGEGAHRRPTANVLLVTIDTLRADHCSSYGYPIRTTPVLDRLAASGVLYRQAYAPTATTAPSHASLLTSLYPRSLGVLKNGHTLDAEFVTLAEVLAGHGYLTAAFVSSLPLRSDLGFAQGFSHYDDIFTRENASLGRQKGERFDRRGDATTAAALAWLDDRVAAGIDRPLFMWVHYVDPHAPYRAPEAFEAEWPAAAGREIKGYDGEVHFADSQLGVLVDAFKQLAPPLGTLTIVTSDHGEGLGDHGWMYHGVNLHEEAVRVPLVLNWKGFIAEGERNWPVELIDVAPTVLRLLRLDPPRSFRGNSLIVPPLFDHAVFLERRPYRSAKVHGQPVDGEMNAVVRKQWKLIHAPKQGQPKLFHLKTDPGEKNNLFSEESERGRRLLAALKRWRERNPPPADSRQPGIDHETARQLRALGYLD